MAPAAGDLPHQATASLELANEVVRGREGDLERVLHEVDVDKRAIKEEVKESAS